MKAIAHSSKNTRTPAIAVAIQKAFGHASRHALEHGRRVGVAVLQVFRERHVDLAVLLRADGYRQHFAFGQLREILHLNTYIRIILIDAVGRDIAFVNRVERFCRRWNQAKSEARSGRAREGELS